MPPKETGSSRESDRTRDAENPSTSGQRGSWRAERDATNLGSKSPLQEQLAALGRQAFPQPSMEHRGQQAEQVSTIGSHGHEQAPPESSIVGSLSQSTDQQSIQSSVHGQYAMINRWSGLSYQDSIPDIASESSHGQKRRIDQTETIHDLTNYSSKKQKLTLDGYRTLQKGLGEMAANDIQNFAENQTKENAATYMKSYKEWEKHINTLIDAYHKQNYQIESDLSNFKAIEPLEKELDEVNRHITEALSQGIPGSASHLQRKSQELTAEINKSKNEIKGKNEDILKDMHKTLKEEFEKVENANLKFKGAYDALQKMYNLPQESVPNIHLDSQPEASSSLGKGKDRATEADERRWQAEDNAQQVQGQIAADAQFAHQLQQEDAFHRASDSEHSEPDESTQRARYTEDQLRAHIDSLIGELNSGTKPAETSIIKIWKESGKELKKEEVTNINQILVEMREATIINNKLVHKVYNHARACNADNKAKKIQQFADWYANPNNKAKKSQQSADWRANPENRAKNIQYSAFRRAKQADKKAAQYETQNTFDNLSASSQNFTPAQGGSYSIFDLDMTPFNEESESE